jgi:hypothetical protein
MIAGRYLFVYCGTVDIGMGWFIVEIDGSVVGRDIGDVVYNGTARVDHDGWITLDLTLTIPAGTRLAQGTSEQDAPHVRPVHAYLPPGFGDGYPQQIQLAPGIVTVMIRRVSDDFVLPPVGTRAFFII